MCIPLPNEIAQTVRDKVATGEYASESEVIRDGLRTFIARDRAVEEWLRLQVVLAYDAPRAKPGGAIPAKQVRTALATAHAKAIKRG